MAEAGGRAVERKHHAAGDRERQHDRRQAAVLRPLARRRRERELRRDRRRARRHPRCRGAGCTTSSCASRRIINITSATAPGTTSRSKRPAASPTGRSTPRSTAQGASPCRCSGAATGSKCRPAIPTARHVDRVRRRLVRRSQRRYARHAGDRARQGRVQAGRHHDRRGHGAHRRPRHAQRDRRSPDHDADLGCAAGPRQVAASGRSRLGHRRLCGRHLAPSARRAGAAHARPRHRRAVVLDRPQGAHARARHEAAGADAAEHDAARAGEARRPHRGRRGAHRRRRRRRRHSQSHQLQAAGAGRLLSRPAPADRRNPRSLWPIDRRHAGHARPDPHRRRSPARSCRAVRRPRRRWRSIPASSPSAPTAPPRSPSTSRTLPARCG